LNRFDNPKEALDWYNRCIEIMPNSYPAWREKAMALNRLKRYDDANETQDKANKIRQAQEQSEEQTHLGFWSASS
jgi:tetratricopeptide (TPR) repeat protein